MLSWVLYVLYECPINSIMRNIFIIKKNQNELQTDEEMKELNEKNNNIVVKS